MATGDPWEATLSLPGIETYVAALRGRSLAHAPHVVVEPLLIRRLELLAWRAAKHLRKRSVQRGSIMLDLEKHAF
jgi:hypothetical protein